MLYMLVWGCLDFLFEVKVADESELFSGGSNVRSTYGYTVVYGLAVGIYHVYYLTSLTCPLLVLDWWM
jgi:hypothetical protein